MVTKTKGVIMSCQISMLSIVFSSCFLFISVICVNTSERPCFSVRLEKQCWPGETCAIQANRTSNKGANGLCQCLKNFHRNPSTGLCECSGNFHYDERNFCIPTDTSTHPPLPTPAEVNSAESSSSSIAAGILVPLVFIGAAVLFVVGRRNHWWERLRQPHVRHYDTALVGGRDDFDDDPPIA